MNVCNTLKCCNCGSVDDVQIHHIIPRSLGGNDIPSNKCALCYKCHSLIHFGKYKNIDHSHLTKEGLKTAKINGKRIGRQQGETVITQKERRSKQIILKHCIDFGGSLTDKEVMQMIGGISRNTYYKYKKKVRVEQCNIKAVKVE